MTAAPKRRWFRFSLRTLFAAVTVLAILLSWVGWRLERARQQGRALADLSSVRALGWVGYDMPQWSPEWLKTIAVFNSNFFSVNRLSFEGFPPVPDDALKHVARLPELEKLKVKSESITDDGLRQLLGLKKLRILGIASPQLTDEGLSILGQMKQLQELAVESPQLTAGGIGRLKRDLPHCQFKSFEMIVTD